CRRPARSPCAKRRASAPAIRNACSSCPGDMTPRRLLTCAAVMHVTLAVVLLVAGRTRIAPALIDSDGIVARAAPDSYPYQRVAIHLAGALRHGDVAAWARNPAPLHTRAIAICFAAFAPLAGD